MHFTVDKGKVINIGSSNYSCMHAIIGFKLAITLEEDLGVTVDTPSKTSACGSLEVRKAMRPL